MPKEGLVFYLSLKKDTNIANTKQILQKTGNFVYQNYKGIPCCYFNGNSYFIIEDQSEFNAVLNTKQITISFLVNINSSMDYNNSCCFVLRSDSPSDNKRVYGQYLSQNNSIEFFNGNNNYQYNNFCNFSNFNNWTHICQTCNNNTLNVYYDGILINSKITNEYNFNNVSDTKLFIGGWKYGNFIGYMSSVRIYNRELTQLEITKLANEFA